MRDSIGGWVEKSAIQPRPVGDAEGLHRLGQLARLDTAQAAQRVHHRRRRSQVLRRSRVGAELAPAREPGDDHRREDAEDDLQHDHGDEVAGAVAALGLEHGAIDDRADDAREEDDERVDDALDQRERDHVAVGDVRHLVREHRLDLLLVHRLQEPGRDGDERRIPECAGRERVGLAFVDRDFRHADAGLLREALHGRHEPRLDVVARLRDDVRAGRPLGHRLRHEERDDRAGEADDRGEHEELAVARAGVARRVEAEHLEDDRQHEDDREVRREEQDDAFHGGPFAKTVAGAILAQAPRQLDRRERWGRRRRRRNAHPSQAERASAPTCPRSP